MSAFNGSWGCTVLMECFPSKLSKAKRRLKSCLSDNLFRVFTESIDQSTPHTDRTELRPLNPDRSQCRPPHPDRTQCGLPTPLGWLKKVDTTCIRAESRDGVLFIKNADRVATCLHLTIHSSSETARPDERQLPWTLELQIASYIY